MRKKTYVAENEIFSCPLSRWMIFFGIYQCTSGCYFPICQVRWGLLNFMSICPPPSFSFLRRTSTGNSRPQCSPPDLKSKLWIKVIPARPSLQTPDQSDPRQTSTASSRSECSPPDLHHKLRIRVFAAGLEPEESQKIYQIECQKKCQKIYNIYSIYIYIPERIREEMPHTMPEGMSEYML